MAPSTDNSPWYVSRSVRIGDRIVRIEGIDPWVKLAMEPGWVGEHARWWLELRGRHQRWPWWQPPPPRLYELRFYDVKPPSVVEFSAGWALTAWAVVRMLRR